MADVINNRSCQWHRVGVVDKVPGKVINSFIPRRTLQRIHDNAALQYSMFLYNENSKENFQYKVNVSGSDIFSLLSSEDCEDLIGIYLQTKGYFLVPSSCKNETMGYEFVLKKDAETAVVQVKNGKVDLNVDEYRDFPGQVYLFTTKGKYLNQQTTAENVITLDRNILIDFMNTNYDSLPERIKSWITILRKVNDKNFA